VAGLERHFSALGLDLKMRESFKLWVSVRAFGLGSGFERPLQRELSAFLFRVRVNIPFSSVVILKQAEIVEMNDRTSNNIFLKRIEYHNPYLQCPYERKRNR
jgi:hypothetical protein